MLYKRITNRISFLLSVQVKTHKDLAEYLGCSEKDVFRICDGELLINSKTLTKIAEFFNVSKGYLLSGKEV